MPRSMIRSAARLLTAAFVSATLLACDSPTDVDDTPDEVAVVEVQDAPATLRVGQSINLNARVRAADGAILNRSVTWSSSDTALAVISAGGMLTARTAGSVRVRASSGGRTGSADIDIVNAAPSAVQLVPAAALSGGAAFELKVVGSGFVPGAAVLWNGQERPTRVVSGTEVVADIAAADLDEAGLASVVVQNPSGEAASERLYFTVQQRPAEPVTAVYDLAGLEEAAGLPIEIARVGWRDAAGSVLPAVQKVVAGTLRTTYEEGTTRWHLAVTVVTVLEDSGEEVNRAVLNWWGSLMYDVWTGMPVLNNESLPMEPFRTKLLSDTELVVFQSLHPSGSAEYERPWLYVKQ
jgi:hypothetical protein